MRIIKSVLWVIGLNLCFALMATAADFRPYQWEEKRSRYVLTEAELAFPEYILKDHNQYEYQWEDGHLIMYVTTHRITRVTDAQSIQRHNQLHVPMRNVIELIALKARSINKEGKVVNFDQSNLKEVKDEKTGQDYRIFAIEGIESDSEVEYFYTLKMKGQVFESLYQQFETPVKQVTFLLTCPQQLKFDFRLYLDSTTIQTDTVSRLNRYRFFLANVPGLEKEPFSYFDVNRKRLEFKLAHNTTDGHKGRLNTWADAAKAFYKTVVYSDDDSEKDIDRFLKPLADNPSSPLAERILKTEDYVKRTIQINEESSAPALSSISSMLKYKQASGEGITKLLAHIFVKLNIPFQVVVTCNREKAKFDGTFDTWAFLDSYLLYFPGPGGFIAPDVAELRFPMVPAKFITQKGLFIEPVEIRKAKSAIGLIREIPDLPYQYNTDNLDIVVSFSDDKSANIITLIRDFTGYSAASLGQYHDLMTNEQKRKLVENIVKQTAPDGKIKSWSTNVATVKDIAHFTVKVEFTTEHLIEKAGSRLLFKAGELIGPQIEMYRQDKRTNEVENNYNRGYDRVIRITFPDGYAVGNAPNLNMNVAYSEGNKIPFLFQSDYKLTGKVLDLKITEFYKQISVPLSRYEDFRRVVNASADFNKVVLVLEKK